MTYLTFLVDTIGVLSLLAFLFNRLVNKEANDNDFVSIAAYSLISALSLVVDMLVQIKELYISQTQRTILAFVEFFLVYMTIFALNNFVFNFSHLKKKTNTLLTIGNLSFLMISVFALIYNLFNPFLYIIETDTIVTLPNVWLAFVAGSFSCILGVISLAIYRKRLIYLVSYAIYAIYGILKLLYPTLTIINVAIVLTCTIMIIVSLLEQSRAKIEKDLELANSDAQLMLSQIQPHFLYNTLSAISSICEKDPKTASKTIDDFAFYLRGNLDSMRNDRSTFQLELKHAQYYTQLEKLRFGDYLNVEYNIQAVDFSFPTLALQPIVENAIRHGVSKREEGGSVYISSFETEKEYVVVVKDNGVGFDTSVKLDNSHVGIENVKRRIKLIVNGEMDICSKINEGTVVTITVPKK